jgi:LytS/YehU family sensor histidine kinase
MLRRDIGVVIPALLIGALIAILVGIAAGWFRV